MAQDASPGKEHEDFTAWALNQGVQINGIRPRKLPGRGIGMVAEKPLEEGERLAFVPCKALLAIDTTPTWLKINELVKVLDVSEKEITVHGALAAYLTVMSAGRVGHLELWRRVWPSLEDFRESMPILWAQEYQELLTPPAKGKYSTLMPLVVRQERRAAADSRLVTQIYYKPSKKNIRKTGRYGIPSFPLVPRNPFNTTGSSSTHARSTGNTMAQARKSYLRRSEGPATTTAWSYVRS